MHLLHVNVINLYYKLDQIAILCVLSKILKQINCFNSNASLTKKISSSLSITQASDYARLYNWANINNNSLVEIV